MPELPEVETMRRGIAAVEGTTISSLEKLKCSLKSISLWPNLRTLRRRTEGQTIAGTSRLGKRVILTLESGDHLVFEPRMTGLLLLAEPPNQTHLRLRLNLTGKRVPPLLYWDRRGLGHVKLLSTEELNTQLAPPYLGPDALEITADDLKQSLRKSQRPVKVALLDQQVVAGIGNLYAAEILHVAEVHPEAQCRRLTTRQWERIATATREVLNEAIFYEGSTLGDGTYRNALNQDGSYQNHHRVYARANAACPRCAAEIVRIVQAGRATFFCPGCQKKR